MLQPEDNIVDIQFAFQAAMDRLVKQQENIVLLEAQVTFLKMRLREVPRDRDDEGGVIFSD